LCINEEILGDKVDTKGNWYGKMMKKRVLEVNLKAI